MRQYFLKFLVLAGLLFQQTSFAENIASLELFAETNPVLQKPQARQLPAVQSTRKPMVRRSNTKKLAIARRLEPDMAQLKNVLNRIAAIQKRNPRNKKLLRQNAKQARRIIARLQRTNQQLNNKYKNSPTHRHRGLPNMTAHLGNSLRNLSAALESQNRLENFKIQDLMSRYTQTQSAMSSIQKKEDDVNNSIIQKIN